MLFRRISISLRLSTLLLLAGVVAGCANHAVRGDFHYDLRSPERRADLVWPKPPEHARYRYVGTLLGEANFKRSVTSTSTIGDAVNWLVGLVDENPPLSLQRPQHGMVGEKDRIYVVDAGRNEVLVFDPHGPADGKSDKDGGQMLAWSDLGNGMRLGSPVAVAQVWNGDIAVSDAKYGVVFRLDKQGKFVAAIGEGQLQRPTGIAFDGKRGLLFVADTVAHEVKVFDAAGSRVNTITHAGDALLNAPTLMTVAGDRLYVTDTMNNRIQVYDLDGKHVRSIGQQGLAVGNLTRPKGVAVGEDGVVYVVESYFGHLLAFDRDARFLMGIKGTGLQDDNFYLPSGVWTDNKGKIYVADMFNGRVVIFQFLGNSKQ